VSHSKKTAYAEAVKQRIVQVLPEKDRYGLWHGRPYPHICKELRDNFIDKLGTLNGKLSGKTIKFHEGATHLNSSQVLCINFFNKFLKMHNLKHCCCRFYGMWAWIFLVEKELRMRPWNMSRIRKREPISISFYS
jgi:hypothetical protein